MFLQGTTEPFIVKTDHKNLISFLITKELNQKQVKQAEILTEYYFKIKYIKGIDNARANILSKRVKLQGGEKPLNAILRLDKNRKIRYNHPQLIKTYKVLESSQEEQIKEAQEEDLKLEDYKD